MNQWQKEWPKGVENVKRTWYWLYGRLWGDKEPRLYPVEVFRVANGTVHITSGQFIYADDTEGAIYWRLIQLPDAWPTELGKPA